MEFQKVKIPATDGYELSAHVFQAAENGKGCVIIGSATAANQAYYKYFARFLKENGYHAITFDYRGIGESLHGDIKTFKGSLLDWGTKDLAGVLRWAESNFGARDLLLVGHSVAGQLFPLTGEHHKVKAAYFVGSQMAYHGHWSGKEKLFVLLFWHLIIPFCTRFFGYLPAWALGGGEHLPADIVRDWQAFGLHPHGILEDDPLRRSKFASVQTATKFVALKDDRLLAPPKSVEALKNNYGGEVTDLKILDPKEVQAESISHFGFFRRKFKDQLWGDVLDWFDKHRIYEYSN